ncbi:unnamed protein product [Ascophyllum nodosum]
MNRYMGVSAVRNRDLAQAEVSISGFGEVETTVLSSLGSLRGAPEPCPTNTPKPARKMCRIFSPVASRSEHLSGGRVPRISNADCQQNALRPLTTDAAFHCPRSTENITRDGVGTSSVEDHGSESKHVHPRPQADRRPITPDSPNHPSGRNSYRLDFDTRVDLRPSTTGKPERPQGDTTASSTTALQTEKGCQRLGTPREGTRDLQRKKHPIRTELVRGILVDDPTHRARVRIGGARRGETMAKAIICSRITSGRRWAAPRLSCVHLYRGIKGTYGFTILLSRAWITWKRTDTSWARETLSQQSACWPGRRTL